MARRVLCSRKLLENSEIENSEIENSEIPVRFLDRVENRLGGRFGYYSSARIGIAVQLGSLQPDVTRRARGGHQQGHNRDEESNHHPAHGTKLWQEYQTERFGAGGRSGLTKAGLEPFKIGVADGFDI